MSWFEEKEADQRWMQGKHGAKMARELELLGKSGRNRSEKTVSKPSACDADLVNLFDVDMAKTSPLSTAIGKMTDLFDTATINESDERADAIKTEGGLYFLLGY